RAETAAFSITRPARGRGRALPGARCSAALTTRAPARDRAPRVDGLAPDDHSSAWPPDGNHADCRGPDHTRRPYADPRPPLGPPPARRPGSSRPPPPRPRRPGGRPPPPPRRPDPLPGPADRPRAGDPPGPPVRPPGDGSPPARPRRGGGPPTPGDRPCPQRHR